MKFDKHRLHIVSFDIPYPPDYGGVIDVYYRIKALHQLGVKIHLHCFEYGRAHAPELQNYCEQLYYYKRKVGVLSFLNTQPYIVVSRRNERLLENLKEVKAPILFEGEHSTAYLNHKELRNYPRWVRLHNIEHRYYNQLALQSRQFFDQIFYRIEAMKLSRYEKILAEADGLLCIAQDEHLHFKEINPNSHWLAASHADFEGQNQNSAPNAYLYHGNLTIEFNWNLALKFSRIFKDRDEKLIIAGKMLPDQEEKLHSLYPWLKVLPNLSHAEMQSALLQYPNHLIFAQHKEGVKLKLIHSLYTGANVIANREAVSGSGLEHIVNVIRLEELKNYMDKVQHNNDQISRNDRPELIDQLYNNRKNAERLLHLIFDKV